MLIYFDMDGVLSDLDGYLADFAGTSLQEIQSDQDFRFKVVQDSVLQQSFSHWLGLKALQKSSWKSLMRRLRSLGHELEILTSYGSWDPLVVGPRAHTGKIRWLEMHYSDIFEEKVLTGFNGVETCKQKQFYSQPGSVLVDDQPSNVEEFNNGFGTAFLFNGDIEDLIARMSEVVDV